jgi:hypothetical protein
VADRDLHDLSLLWQMIEAASAISCPEEVEAILPTLTQTRVRFADLQQRLVHQLGAETLAELGDELASTGLNQSSLTGIGVTTNSAEGTNRASASAAACVGLKTVLDLRASTSSIVRAYKRRATPCPLMSSGSR